MSVAEKDGEKGFILMAVKPTYDVYNQHNVIIYHANKCREFASVYSFSFICRASGASVHFSYIYASKRKTFTSGPLVFHLRQVITHSCRVLIYYCRRDILTKILAARLLSCLPYLYVNLLPIPARMQPG